MKLFRGLIRKILGLVLLVALVAGILFLLPLTEQTDTQGLARDASWMGTLPDTLRLSEISIPGTHNSASRFAQVPFFTRCQGASIGEQLAMGFRYLDIRLYVDADSSCMKLCHGSFACTVNALPNAEPLYLDAVLEECYAFLKQHPTETILFAVKQESGGGTVAEFQAVLYSNILKNIGAWLLTDTMPTLGEARGKLVLLRRYEDEARLGYAAGLSFQWADQGGSSKGGLAAETTPNGSYSLTVQDRYEYNDADKWAAFTSGVASARGQMTQGNVSLSFLSTKGSLPVGHPWAHAQKLNSALRNRGDGLSGWIILDFGEPYLARMVYESNALYGTQTAAAVTSPSGTTGANSETGGMRIA